MNNIISYVTDNPMALIIIIIAAMIIISVLKSLFKMAMTIAVIGLIMVVFFGFQPQEVLEKGKDLAENSTQLLDTSTLMDKLIGEDFFIKQENGKTIVEIESLGVKYDLNELLAQLTSEEKQQFQKILEK